MFIELIDTSLDVERRLGLRNLMMFVRKIALVGLVLGAGALAACSFITDVVIANLSDKPIEVKYRIKEYPGTFSPPETPATKASSQ